MADSTKSEHLKEGKASRLFPVHKKIPEDVVSEILLSVFSTVPELFEEIFGEHFPSGSRTTIETWNQVSAKRDEPRPDGLIVIRNSRQTEQALVEVKVNNDKLNREQLKGYIGIARDQNIKSLITVSNEFTPHVTDHPIPGLVRSNSTVSVYHASWRRLWTASLKIRQEIENSNDKSTAEKTLKVRILQDFAKFIDDGAVGKKSFSRMPQEWAALVNNYSGNRSNRKILGECTDSLIQEFTEITFILTEVIGGGKFFELRGANTKTRAKLTEHIENNIKDKGLVRVEFGLAKVPETFFAEINLQEKTIIVGMKVAATESLATNRGRVTQLKKQIIDKGEQDIPASGYPLEIEVRWFRKSKTSTLPWAEFDIDQITEKQKEMFGETKSGIIEFTPTIKMTDSKRFSAPEGFIKALEEMVTEFYGKYAWKLQNWKPNLPKPKQ